MNSTPLPVLSFNCKGVTHPDLEVATNLKLSFIS